MWSIQDHERLGSFTSDANQLLSMSRQQSPYAICNTSNNMRAVIITLVYIVSSAKKLTCFPASNGPTRRLHTFLKGRGRLSRDLQLYGNYTSDVNIHCSEQREPSNHNSTIFTHNNTISKFRTKELQNMLFAPLSQHTNQDLYYSYYQTSILNSHRHESFEQLRRILIPNIYIYTHHRQHHDR